jgi:hypothetical protein
LGRGSDELNKALAPYVCVRITNLRDVDVRNLRFDFDLTFAAMLMHADGTVYHRYGSRGADGPADHLSLTSLAALLRDTVPEHQAYERTPQPPAQQPPLPAIRLPHLAKKIAQGEKIECVHCHTINDAEFAERELAKTWKQDDLYVFPDPARLGLTLDREHQALVTAVAAGSPAAAAGLRKGDELTSLGEQASVRTLADVQWALHKAAFGDTQLPIAFRRGADTTRATIALRDGWKRCPPEDYAWRPFKWNLSPSSGFGGQVLSAAEREQLGIAAGKFAMRVGYIVDWGDRAARGRAARQAGLKNGDVVVGFAGKDDFVSVPHFHAWVSLTRTAGEDTEIVVLRGKERTVLRYALPQ